MNNEEFDNIVDERTLKIKSVLTSKGSEYGREDRLHNFKEAATRNHCTPEKALQGMATKHDISISDMINDIESGQDSYITKEYLDEKVGDAINYLILLEALIIERIGNNTKKEE